MGRRSYYYEIPVFYAFLFLIERAFFSGQFPLNSSTPSPYWLGVLLFSLRYGAGAGILSGLASAGLAIKGAFLSGDLYLFEDVDFYLAPALFVLGGAACGAVVDRLLHRARGFELKLEEQREKIRAVLKELEIQQKSGRAIEQQVVSQMSSLVTLYQGSRNLASLDRDALFKGILDFFSTALKANKAALYLRQGDRWVLHTQKGWHDGDGYAQSLDFTQGLVGKAGSENRVVSLRDWFLTDIEKAWEGRSKADALLAGPLRRGSEVVGVYSVQDIPFLRFNSANLNLLTLLLDWADEAISKCLYFEELKLKSITDVVYNVYNEQYFQSRCEQEFSRSKTHALPFSILLISVEGIGTLPINHQVNYMLAVSRLLTESSQKIDIVTKFPDPGTPFAVLLMTAGEDQAAELRDKILRSYAVLSLVPEQSPSIRLKIGIGSYAAQMNSKEELIEQAKRNLL